jgi:hypothetical protein
MNAPGRDTNLTELTDSEFVRMFETCELPNECFHHRDHIRLAWIYLQRYGELEAGRQMGQAIRNFAAHHGKSDKYHETLTVAWLRLVQSAIARTPQAAKIEDLSIAAPELLDKRTIEKFYSPAALASDKARTSWVEPDRQALP